MNPINSAILALAKNYVLSRIQEATTWASLLGGGLLSVGVLLTANEQSKGVAAAIALVAFIQALVKDGVKINLPVAGAAK
ncbi:hypothetical protein M2322_002661 [Rhodoblastus acidophilus]|uniref:hypothetical protein n=1 Tax=Rhodoblastus acidophilus TaxID=1074 RepID=UPI0022244CF4|nr:hypothetical protein [Rhodoblastus acidophilus]MCW2317107.1 hypothetical protein [Rhodoblastus acidophilus]